MRPNWERYALELAHAAACRSQDPWIRVGAVVMDETNAVRGVGYNGAPAGVELDWSDREARRQFVIHAEQNAFRFTNTEVYDGMLAITHIPCHTCLLLAAAYQIKVIVYSELLDVRRYDPQQIHGIARELGIQIKQVI